jgi:hypothetical protein
MNVDEVEDLPTFDLPDAPSRDEDKFSKLNGSLGSPTVQAQSVEAVDLGSQVEYEDMSSFKRVIVVEVEMNIIPSKPLVSESTRPRIDTPTGYTHYPPYNTPPGHCPFSATPTPTSGPSPRPYSRNTSGDAYGYPPRGAFSPRYNSTGYYVRANASRNKSSSSVPASRQSERRNAFSYRASYAGSDSDSDEYEYVDVLVDGVIYRMPARRPTRDVYSYRGGGGGTAQYCYSQVQGYQYEREDPDASPNYDLPAPRRRRQSSSTPQRPHTARPTNSSKKPRPTPESIVFL